MTLVEVWNRHGVRANGCLAVNFRVVTGADVLTVAAKADSSIEKINLGIAAAKKWLHVGQQADWKGPLYQSANRLAHLYFFREILRIDAWLVNIYFTDDPHSRTSRTQWQGALADVKKSLGIGVVPHCADVFLPAV